ncbi:MAG TPA: NUDIX hydrolase [Candidatus Saccharimonadales bacterium]
MKNAVRAIVVKENKLLVMHRNKFGKEYDTLIGGGVDMGETAEHALFRELAEETGIQVANARLVFLEEAGAPYGTQHIFLCDYVSGEPALNPQSDEAQINKLGSNLYTPKWLSLEDLPAAPFVSPRLKAALLDCFKNGFPSQAQTL